MPIITGKFLNLQLDIIIKKKNVSLIEIHLNK